MKNLKRICGIGALALLASVAVPKKTQAQNWSAKFQNTFASKHVDNGILKSSHVVAIPRLTFRNNSGQGNLSFSGSVNVDLHEEDVTKINFGANYYPVSDNNIQVELGYTRKMSQKDENWNGLDVFDTRTAFNASLQPSLEFQHFFNEGTYFGLSAQRPIYLCEPSLGGRTFLLSAELGYNIHLFRERTGFSHLETSLSVPLTMPVSGFLSKFQGELRARYSASLADDIKDNWVAEFNASKSF